ncbi:vacuole protein, variant 2 [Coprinopsis cinerea AmutBmut pab1-1]|nr:vacuole protein, variant 2 [Coprinopsis cinerea AmutBmut pab1-1]
MANNYYSLRSYDHFCFFEHISDSTKLIDDFAFFVFFTFKSWKRLLLADGPRQTINGLTLYAVWLIRKDNPGAWYHVTKYFEGNSLSTTALTLTALFTVSVFLGSLLLLIIAGICYIPLLIHIRGNLKEYCCHKVDKRISDIIKRKNKERRAENAKIAQKEAMGDFSHYKNKKGEMVGKPLPQPTLPNVSLDDDDDTSTLATRVAPSTHTKASDYYPDKAYDYPPPMPAYNPYSNQQQYNQSSASLGYDDAYYSQPYEDEDTARLTASAAPVAYAGSNYHDYPARSASTAPSAHRYSPTTDNHPPQYGGQQQYYVQDYYPQQGPQYGQDQNNYGSGAYRPS